MNKVRRQLKKAAQACAPKNVWKHSQRLSALTVPEATAAVAAYAGSYTPSLLPRPFYIQGPIAGMGAMFGYQVGLLGSWLMSEVAHRNDIWTHIKPGIRQGGRIAGAALGLAGAVAIPLASISWQKKAAVYSHQKGPDAFWALASSAAALATFSALYAQWRAVFSMINWVTKHLDSRWSYTALSRLTATFITLTTILIIFDRIVMRGVIGFSTVASAHRDQYLPPNVTQPTSELHSGSIASMESWNDLGLQGKRFTCAGPSRERILEVMGDGEAKDPVRAYASMNGRSVAEVVDAVLAEMDRTDAWSRKSILVITTTGRGNVNEWSTSTFEFLNRGDCASVAMQYSGLPSAVTMITEKSVPVRASRMLFEMIEGRIDSMPEGQRPKLYVAGESLGAFGSNGIFDNPADLLARCDGAVWTGCPSFAPLHTRLTESRHEDSLWALPVIDHGKHVRFASEPEQIWESPIDEPYEEWTAPRFCYLQNDTDPVVVWDTPLLWKRPEWLTKPLAGTPSEQMTWLPFITFWQVVADMTVCRTVGPGRGHKYHADHVVPAWAGVLGLDPTASWETLKQALRTDVPPVAP